ncbi:MAG: dTMP kinase [Actinobacteria bacterium]|nr:dTMP kinase [Actinomycetota bacterium]
MSSLGDWMGVIAIAVVANQLGGVTAVGTVMIARVLPGFIVGPLAGVFADRWDRKRLMVSADIARGLIIFSIPFVPTLLYLLIASVVLESLTLIWGPAKDASLPHFVGARRLAHANSLSLIAIYGAWPLASIAYSALSTFGSFIGGAVPVLEGLRSEPEAMALWVDSFSFLFSAAMIFSLSIRTSTTKTARLDLSQIRRDLLEGLTFVRDHRQVRPWMLGIAMTFTAAGAVFSLGVEFVQAVLNGGPRGFSFLIGFLATGMIIGLLSVGLLARLMQRDVLFSSSILLLGAGLIGLAGMSGLGAAIPIASALGFFGGVGYSTGYTLMQERTPDEFRGRTFSAAYTIIRIGILLGLGVFPLIAGLLGDHALDLPWGALDLPRTRTTLWAAGLVAIGGGIMSMRAIGERPPVLRRRGPGLFVVFEGGEGAGKTTQMEAFVDWLRARGDEVVTTREPGGTRIGRRIRDILLDPESAEMVPRGEALLYAADRAQHAEEFIKPALDEGRVVVSDRYLDSSLAYQGVGRDLGVQEILDISEWATQGLYPDIVFFLNVSPSTARVRHEREPDRIERERDEFHERIADGYMELSRQFPERIVVIDASRSPQEVHEEIRQAFEDRADQALAAPVDITSGRPKRRPPR